MPRFSRFIPALVLVIGAFAAADTVWSPAASYPAAASWSDAAHWTNGLPDLADKAQFNVDGTAECIVETAVGVGMLAMGDNGTQTGTFLRIVNGGTLTTHAVGSWSAVGYNRPATLIVEAGGTLNTAHRLFVGRRALTEANGVPSHLIVDGGTVIIHAGNLQMGLDDGFGLLTVDGGGVVDIRAGTLTMGGDMLIDVREGTILMHGDGAGAISAWEGTKIVAYGGLGVLIYDYDDRNPGKTTITALAVDPTPPSPNPATFSLPPVAIGANTITMTATVGWSVNGPVQYLFKELSGNPGGLTSGWQSDPVFTATGLQAETTYIYTVTLRDPFGIQTDESAPASATTWSATTTDIIWNKTGSPGNWATASHWTGTNPKRPDGNFNCRFTNSNRAESRVTGSHIFNQLVQNANSTIRVQNGGCLTATASWSSIGYNSGTSNRMIVEGGGVVNISGHMWIGFSSPSIGILDIDGGTVNVSQQFGLGWNGGTGYVNVRDGGVLNLNRMDGVNSIKGASILNVESGYIVINGDRTNEVGNYVSAGKIVAYGGAGRVLYDYNATHHGKTTIQAFEPVDGDINRDGGVDIGDLAMLASDWLVSDCDSPANFDPWCLVNYRDFAVLASNWLGGIMTTWRVVETIYPTDDIIVTPYDAGDFGIVADGQTDVTDALQTALISIDNLGGGTLFLPAGQYKVSGTLTIPAQVTLRGDWPQPQPGSPIDGTILQAYAGRGDENAAAFIRLIGSAGIKGITIWYPEQLPTDIQPYPPTIQMDGGTVEDVTFVNSYFGVTTFREGTTARPFVRNVYGTPLKTGIEYDCLADIGRIETVHFSPAYWAGSGLAGAPTAGQHEGWLYDHGTGLIVRRIDWSYSCYVTVEGYNIGLALRSSRYDGKYPNGQSYRFNLLNCQTGVYIQASANAGYQFTRFNIQSAERGVYLSPSADQATLFHTCSIQASVEAILSDGAARVMMMSSDLQGPLNLNGGYISVINSRFGAASPHHIRVSGGVRGATLQGNTFAGSAQIINNTSYPVLIDSAPVAADPLPAYDFKKPTMAYQSAKTDLYVVTDAPYHAAADGVTDDTGAFQAALADAGANGGGIVFVPGGNYRLNGTLVVPTGVELRGIYDTSHSTREKGSLLNVYAGRSHADGTPFIQLEHESGVRGLNFHYPEQIYDENDDDPQTGMYGFVPYPYLIRGLGADIYVINIAATIPYQLLDLATYRCDRHYVDYIFATALKTGIHIGHGTTDGQLHNVQLNPSAYTHQGLYYDSIPIGTADNVHKIQWRDATPYLFGHMTGQVLHQNFVFGGAKGVHTVQEGGFGPSGHCLGMGVDQCTNALQIDSIGSGGLDMINSQIVTVNGTVGRYLETGASLDGVFRMFSSAGWGTHQYSAMINGGDVRLQLFHLFPVGQSGVFRVRNTAVLHNLGGNLRDYLGTTPSGRLFLDMDTTASAAFVGNVINTVSSKMPSGANVTSRGNLRVQ